MDKDDTPAPQKKYFKIGDVSRMLEVAPSTLRFWEKEFRQLNPMKNKKGDRIYSLKDIEILKEIKYLTHDKGIKIAKANKKVKKNVEAGDHKHELAKKLLSLRELLIDFKNTLD
jgi:DNA-binding transcriptional MerR regulator